MNLGETIIYCGLGGLFICGAPCVACVGLIYLVQGLLYACRLFPQCVPAVTPLFGVVQMQSLVPGPGRGGGRWLAPTPAPRVWEGGSGSLWQSLKHMPAVSCPLRAHTREKGYNGRSHPSPWAPPKQWHLASKATQASSSYTLSCGCTRFLATTPRLFPHSQPQSSRWVWSLKPEYQHPAPADTHLRLGSPQWQHWPSVLSPLWLPQTSCCVLQGSEAPYCPG